MNNFPQRTIETLANLSPADILFAFRVDRRSNFRTDTNYSRLDGTARLTLKREAWITECDILAGIRYRSIDLSKSKDIRRGILTVRAAFRQR